MNTNNKIVKQRGSDGERFAYINKLGEHVFHDDDLGNLWHIHNKNTLYKTLSRYVKRGLLFRIYSGLYSVKKVSELDPYFLGIKSVHRPAYVSCESILYDHGILNQAPRAITLVSSISKSFSVGQRQYRVRQMRDQYLFNDAGIEVVHGIRKASLPRAIADMLYFNSKKYFDALGTSLIDWVKVKKIVHDVGYNTTI